MNIAYKGKKIRGSPFYFWGFNSANSVSAVLGLIFMILSLVMAIRAKILGLFISLFMNIGCIEFCNWLFGISVRNSKHKTFMVLIINIVITIIYIFCWLIFVFSEDWLVEFMVDEGYSEDAKQFDDCLYSAGWVWAIIIFGFLGSKCVSFLFLYRYRNSLFLMTDAQIAKKLKKKGKTKLREFFQTYFPEYV